MAARDLNLDLKEHFVSQGYTPGDVIEPEMELAAQFGVPRAKMREALSAMCQEGLLTRRAGSGTVVQELEPESIGQHLGYRFRLAGLDAADAHEARVMIETSVLPLAVRRITPRQLANLRETVARMQAYASTPEIADEADRDFHLGLLEASGNKTLSLFGGVITMLFEHTRRREYWHPDLIQEATEEHAALLDEIESGDSDEAVHLLHRHLTKKRVAT